MSNLIRRALTEMADEARKAEVVRNLARTALNDARHFGRPQSVIDDLAAKLAALESPEVQVEVPRAPLDPVSVEYAAVGGPRSWAEQRVLTAAGESALENASGPVNEATDALRGNALMRSRLERLSPEQRAQSIASIAFQAQDDARAAAMQRAATSERRRVQTKAAMDAIGSAVLRHGVKAAALGMAGYGWNQNMADLSARRATRKDDMDFINEALGDISFDPGVAAIEDAAADLTRPDVPSMDDVSPDIFTEDPAISWSSESDSDAIRRILKQRYGR